MPKTAIRGAIIAFTLAWPAGACGQNADHGQLVWSRADNPEMSAARVQARQSLAAFFGHLAKPAKDESVFEVKFNLNPNGEAEFIWAGHLKWRRATLTGKLANKPLTDGYRIDQRVVIDRDLIVDWGYFKGRIMQGQFTTRAMLPRLPKTQADGFVAAFGW